MAPKDYSTYLKLERLKEENNTQKLIRLYRDNDCLWNPQSSGYHSASVKDDAWRRVTRLMNSGLTPDQVKLQVLALRNYYDKECTAIRKSQLEGYSYLPRRAYFEDLHFLKGPDGLTDPKGDEGSLVNALVLKDERNDSEETICEGAVSLCPGSSETKDNYTYYKLILEPEQASLSIKSRDGVEGIIGRSASGNDRWYPTSYCVKCGQETGENPCIGCCGRGKRFCAPREPSLTSLSQDDSYYSMRKPQRRNQFDDDQCSYSRCSQPRQNFRSNYQQPQSQGPRYQESSCDSVCSESTYVDMDNGSDDWPSPHLCGQRRPKVTPRYRYVVSDHGLKECCSSSWERNNEAICRRLQAQLAKQSNQNKCSSPSQNSGRGSCNRNFRYQSGEDELNVMLLKDCRCRQSQAINCQCAVHSELYNNNSPQQDPGRFQENQPNPQPQTPPSENPPMQVTERYNDDQMEVPDRYNIEQKNYSSFPCDCQCNSFRQQPHQPPSYYQQNQYEEGPTSYPLPAMPDTTAQIDQYGEMGVPCPFLTNFDPSTAEPQAHVYCYSTEMWPQDTGMCESCKRQNKSCWSTCPVYRRSNDDRSELACDTVCNGPFSSNRGAPDNRNVYSEESGGVVNQKIPSNNLEELPRENNMPEQEDKSLDGRQRADVGESSDERSRGRPYSRGNNEEPSVRSQRDVALDPFLEENFCNEAACREGRDCRIGYEDRPRQKIDRNDESSMNSNYSNQRRRIRGDVPSHENPENQQIQQQPLNENYVQDQKFKAYPLSTDVSQFGKCPESCPKYRRNGDYREDRKPMPSADRKNQEWNGENISSRSKGLDDRDYQDEQRGIVSSRSKGPEVPLPPGYEAENEKPRAKTRPQDDRSYQEQNRENMSSRSRGPEDSIYQDRHRGSISSTSKGPEVPAPPEYGSENEKPEPKIRSKGPEVPLPNNDESDNDQPQPKTRALDDRSYQEANRSVSSKSKGPEQPDYESDNEQPVKKSNKMPRSKDDSDTMEEKQIGRSKSNYEDQEENLNSRRRSFDEKTNGSSNRYEDNCVDETCPNMGARNRQRNYRNNNTEVPGCNNKTCPRLKSISYLRGGDGRRHYRESFNVEDQNRNYRNERRHYRPQEDRRTRRQFECNDCTNDKCPYREEENVDYSDEPLPSRQNKDRRTNRRTNDENCTRDTCLYRDDEEKSYSNGRRPSRSRKNPTNRNADTEAILPEEDDRNKNYSKKRPQKGRITNRDADENFCTDKTCRYKKKDSSKQNETEERKKRRKYTESEKILSDNEKNYTRRYKNNGDADEDFCSDETCKYNQKDSSKKNETEETRRNSTESEKILSDTEKNYTRGYKNNRNADEDFCSDETCEYKRKDSSKLNETEERNTRRRSTESEKILSDNEKNYKARSKNDRDADEDFCSDGTCKYNQKDSSKKNETEETRRKSTESEKILSDNEKNYKTRSKNDRDADEDFCSDDTCKYKRKDSSKLNEREGRNPRRKFNESEKILSDNERNYTKKSRNNSPPKSPRYQPRTRSVEKRKKASPSSKSSNNDDCDCDWEEKLREERSERYRNPIYDEESEERYQNDSSKGGDRSGRGFLNYHLANPDEDVYDDDYYSDDDRGNYTERDTRKKRNLDDCRCIEEAPATSSRRKSNGRSQRSDAPRYDNRSKRDDFDNGYDENEEAYDRNRNPKPAPPKEMNVTETSPYLSEYDCLCSDEELYQRNARDQKGKDDQNQKTTKNPPTDETKDQQSTDDDKKPQETEENVCECHSDSDEKMKADDPEADGVRVTRSSAGNGLVSSKSPFLSKVKRNVPLGITILAPISINNKQFEVVQKFPVHDMTTFSLKEQVQGLKTSSQDSARNPIPVKKKPTHNNNGASTSFAKPSKPSPNRRGSVTPKSQMVEPIKRRTQVSSHSNPQSKHMTPLGNRRPTTRKQEYTKDSDN
ncbi:trichohyalin isoform X2 [Drosophila bipectinata]